MIILSCRVANTGRREILPVKIPEDCLIEIDTATVPVVLQGLESLITDAVRRQKIRLKPGEISKSMVLEIGLPAFVMPRTGGCSDLVFDSAWIVGYEATEISIRYSIRNTGRNPVYVLQRTGAREGNLAIRSYFIREKKMTRGAILAETTWLQNGIESFDGILRPGRLLVGTVVVPLEKRTRLTPNLILELDPFLSVDDCDRTNNTIPVLIKW